MKPNLVLPLAVVVGGVACAVLQPFHAIGADWQPGLADLVNGSVGLGLMIVGTIWAALAVSRNRKVSK
jgi:hypothetical protein